MTPSTRPVRGSCNPNDPDYDPEEHLRQWLRLTFTAGNFQRWHVYLVGGVAFALMALAPIFPYMRVREPKTWEIAVAFIALGAWLTSKLWRMI